MAIVAAQNLIDKAFLLDPNVGWSTQLPLANLKDRRLRLVARTWNTNPQQTNFVIDFGVPRQVGLIAIIKHTMSVGAKWRAIFSNSPTFSSIIFDTNELRAWRVLENFGTLPWGVFTWGGIISPEIAERYPSNAFYVMPPNQIVLARYMKLYLLDAANEDGYIDLGRVYAGPVWRPSVQFALPFALGIEDPSRVTYARGGTPYVDLREKKRIMRFRLSQIPDDEMLGQALDQIDLKLGVGGDIVVIPQEDRPEQFHRAAVYGRMRVLNPVVWQTPGTMRTDRDFEIEELV